MQYQGCNHYALHRRARMDGGHGASTMSGIFRNQVDSVTLNLLANANKFSQSARSSAESATMLPPRTKRLQTNVFRGIHHGLTV
jgi:hypothetical protein